LRSIARSLALARAQSIDRARARILPRAPKRKKKLSPVIFLTDPRRPAATA
jgi:hypothetical protein